MKIEQLPLKQNEVVVLSKDEVGFGDEGTSAGMLVITNINIIFAIETMFFHKLKDLVVVPIDSIKESGGIILNEIYVEEADEYGLGGSFRIYSDNGASYKFWMECEYNMFLDVLNVINYKATGIMHAFKLEDVDEGNPKKKKTQRIVINEDVRSNIGLYIRKTMSCPGCGAPIVGYAGLVAKCEYCHNEVVL